MTVLASRWPFGYRDSVKHWGVGVEVPPLGSVSMQKQARLGRVGRTTGRSDVQQA